MEPLVWVVRLGVLLRLPRAYQFLFLSLSSAHFFAPASLCVLFVCNRGKLLL
jgi:hypothetical protein